MQTSISPKFCGHKVYLNLFLLLLLALSFTSCVDKGDYSFNEDYVKELYDKTFPVKNIDPNQDWKTTSVVTLNVTVYEDVLEKYKIKVYDDAPGDPETPANRLAMGEVENGKTIQLSFDCPIGLDTVWVTRVDKANRAIGKHYVLNNENNVVFGDAASRSRSYTQNNGVVIQTEKVPYTSAEIINMLATALEVESGKAIGRGYGQLSKTNVYKLTQNANNYNFVYDGSDNENVLIVTTDWKPSSSINVNGDNLTIVIANGGSFSGVMNITNKSNLIVLPGGKIIGSNTQVNITNASKELKNYNGGVIDIRSLTISTENGTFYNAGNLKLNTYTATNAGTTLINMGDCYIKSLNAANANIENGCYMNIDGDLSVTSLVVGNNSVVDCKSLNLNKWENMSILLGNNSMIDSSSGNIKPDVYIKGSGYTKSLVKMAGITTTYVSKKQYYSDVSLECGDLWDAILNWGTTHRFLSSLGNNNCYVGRLGNSPVLLPSGSCTGNGNTPGTGSDTDDEQSTTYTYCYEDYYPKPGDYDFNDVVMDMSYKLTKENNMIKSVEIPIQLTAVGASYTLGGALQLVGLDKSNIESATVTNSDLGVGNLFSDQSTEAGKNTYYVIPLYSDAHHALTGQSDKRFMYNTSKGHENYADATPRQMTVNIVFRNPIQSFGLDNLDLFIARGLNGYYEGQQDRTRIEVHLREFWDNRTANGVNFYNNEAIAGNRTWAICVPNFKYPYETVPIYRVDGVETGSTIECAYPEFQQWASDRNSAKQWYLSPNPGTTYR